MRIRFAKQALVVYLFVATLPNLTTASDELDRWRDLERQRNTYRSALDFVRNEHGGVRELPPVDFLLLGMGSRTKFIYAEGRLTRALTGEVVNAWEVANEMIIPPAYTVALRKADGSYVFITEDDEAVWVEESGKKSPVLGNGPSRTRVCRAEDLHAAHVACG